MILEYCEEGTLDYENVEFDDNHYKFVLELHKICRDNYPNKCSPLIVRKDRKSILFRVDTANDRVECECNKNAYRIIIEKI